MLKKKKTSLFPRAAARNRICSGSVERGRIEKQAKPQDNTIFVFETRTIRELLLRCQKKEREDFAPTPHTPITGSGAALNEDNVERVSPPATTGDHHRVGKRE